MDRIMRLCGAILLLFIVTIIPLRPVRAQSFSLSRSHVTFQGSEGMSCFGFSTAAGDVNGDGFADVLVGAYNTSAEDRISVGKVYLYSGRGTLLGNVGNTRSNASFEGIKPFDEAGFAVAVGEVNGDRFADVIIGAPGVNKKTGAVYIFSGNQALLGEMSLRNAWMTLDGQRSGDRAGAALAVGDVNGDGVGDIIVGAPGAGNKSGSVYVITGGMGISGARNLSNANAIYFGSGKGDEAGTSVAVGDMNGDETGDIIIGAPMTNEGAGSIFVVLGRGFMSGNNNLSAAAMSIEGREKGDQAGFSVAGGDINGDGFADVIAGAPLASPGGSRNSGETYVIFGRRNLPLQLNLAFADVTLQGEKDYDQAGISVAAANINGDPYREIVVGANFAKEDSVEVGEAYIFKGKRDLHGIYNILFSMLSFRGKSREAEAGCSVSSGDFNGDGFGDVIVGSYRAPVGKLPEVGEVYVIYGLGLY